MNRNVHFWCVSNHSISGVKKSHQVANLLPLSMSFIRHILRNWSCRPTWSWCLKRFNLPCWQLGHRNRSLIIIHAERINYVTVVVELRPWLLSWCSLDDVVQLVDDADSIGISASCPDIVQHYFTASLLELVERNVSTLLSWDWRWFRWILFTDILVKYVIWKTSTR